MHTCRHVLCFCAYCMWCVSFPGITWRDSGGGKRRDARKRRKKRWKNSWKKNVHRKRQWVDFWKKYIVPANHKHLKTRVNFLCMKIIDSSIRTRLHQTSATTLQQLCDDVMDFVISENNGVPGNWVAVPFWSDSIVFNGNGIPGII